MGSLSVLTDVLQEMKRQIKLFGVQHLPPGTGHDIDKILLERAREDFERAQANGMLSWRDVLREEYHEVLAEQDPVKIREELVQVMAVCASWVRDIDATVGGGL